MKGGVKYTAFLSLKEITGLCGLFQKKVIFPDTEHSP